jgi:hypothetical protein
MQRLRAPRGRLDASPAASAGSATERSLLDGQPVGPVLCAAVLVCATTVGVLLLPPLYAAVALPVVLLLCCFGRAFAGTLVQAAWSAPVLLSLAFVATDLAGISIASGATRYAVLLVAVVPALLLWTDRIDAFPAVRLTTLALFVFGMAGSLYGRLALGTMEGALPIVLPLLILVLAPARASASGGSTLRALRLTGGLALAFGVLCVPARLGVPGVSLDVFNHEKAFVLILGIGASVAAASWILVILNTGVLLVLFGLYPAATYILAVLTLIGTATVALMRWSMRVRLVVAMLLTLAVGSAVLNIDSLIRLTNSYFDSVGKTDNGHTRADLYHLALERIYESPLVSSAFTQEITVSATLSGRINTVLPVHNDFLSTALGGGIIGAVLLIAVFLFCNGVALRSLAATRRWSSSWLSIVAFQGSLNAAAVTAFANPILMNPGSSVLVFSIAYALLGLCHPIIYSRPAHTAS